MTEDYSMSYIIVYSIINFISMIVAIGLSLYGYNMLGILIGIPCIVADVYMIFNRNEDKNG